MSDETCVESGPIFYELEANKLDRLSDDIARSVNKLSLEGCVNMPDFIIGDYLAECFKNLVTQTQNNHRWHK